MTTPLYRSVGAAVQSASAATLSPALPTLDTGANGLLLCTVTSKNNALHSTTTTGWTTGTGGGKLAQLNSGAGLTTSVFYARQGAAAPTITWTGAAACEAHIVYYTDPGGVIDAPVVINSNTGTGSPHTTTSATTSREHSLALIIDVTAQNTAPGIPTGWTGDASVGASTAAIAVRHNSREMDTAGTVGATSVTTTATTAAWLVLELELQRQSPGPLEASKLETGAWFEPPKDNLAASKLGVGLWLIPNDNQLRASKMEVGLWLVKGSTRRPHLLFSAL